MNDKGLLVRKRFYQVRGSAIPEQIDAAGLVSEGSTQQLGASLRDIARAERAQTPDERAFFADRGIPQLQKFTAILVAKRQVIEKVFDRPEPGIFQLLGALRADSLYEPYWLLEERDAFPNRAG
jgi:hypothetical protein